MTERKLLTLDDFVKQPTTYTRFGEKVTRNPLEQIYDAGLLKDYKQLSVSSKYLKFTGMQEENDGGEGWYIRDDSITDDEDIGVIIYIGQYKYRRLYGAYVLVDWFYTGDFGIALQRACKYASVRCIPGKVYECNSEITLKLDVRSASKTHGLIDYGHVLIDLRGATINYNVEGSSYCFNIRIYNRETKFMLTNGTFNVSDESKVYLKNIANVIGGNNYTDMLTDMHYNVDKDLLPDTNRVVLFSEPVVEGVKTFSKSLNYVGDSLSAGDNQAVTKDYVNVTANEDAYIAIGDSRKIEGITKFDQLYDRLGNNLVASSDVSGTIFIAMQAAFNTLLYSININMYLPSMYYVTTTTAEEPSVIIGGNWYKYKNTDTYYVYKLDYSEYVCNLLSRMVIDEQDIGETAFAKVISSKPMKIPVADTEVEHNIYTSDSINVYSDIASIYIDASCAKFTSEALKTAIEADTNVFYLVMSLRYKNTCGYIPNWQFVTTALLYNKDGKMYITPVVSGPYNDTTHKFSYKNTDYIVKCAGSIVNAVYRVTVFNIQQDCFYENITIPGITVADMARKIKKGLSANIIMRSNEYASSVDNTIYVKDYNIVDNYIEFTEFYIAAFIPVQANLLPALSPNTPNICFTYNYFIIYNREPIYTNKCDVYIPRYMSTGVPEYEIPMDLRISHPTLTSLAIKARYPITFIYSNYYLFDRVIRLADITGIFDNSTITKLGFNYTSAVAHREVDLSDRCYTEASCNSSEYFTVYTKYVKDSNKDTKVTTDGYNVVTAGESGYACGRVDTLSTSSGRTGLIIIDSINANYTAMHDYNCNNDKLLTGYSPTIKKVKLENTKILKYGDIYSRIDTLYVNNNMQAYSAKKAVGRYTCYCYSSYCSSDSNFNLGVRITNYFATPYLFSFSAGLCKNKLVQKLFGKGATSIVVLRDGVLKDPFRERTLNPEHQFAAPVGALNP